MTDLEAHFRELWTAYREGEMSVNDWQAALRDVVGLQRFVRLEREREMLANKRRAAKHAGGWR